MQDALRDTDWLVVLPKRWNKTKAELHAAAKLIDGEYDAVAVGALARSEQQALLLVHVKNALASFSSPTARQAEVLAILRAREDNKTNTLSHKRYTRLLRLIDKPQDTVEKKAGGCGIV